MTINFPEPITWKSIVIQRQIHSRGAALDTLASVVPVYVFGADWLLTHGEIRNAMAAVMLHLEWNIGCNRFRQVRVTTPAAFTRAHYISHVQRHCTTDYCCMPPPITLFEEYGWRPYPIDYCVPTASTLFLHILVFAICGTYLVYNSTTATLLLEAASV